MTPENENKTHTLLNVGIDFGNESAQISYFSDELNEPKSISTMVGEEKFQIPMVLFKKSEGDQWYIGEEAYRMSWKADGVLLPELLELCKNQETIKIEGKEWDSTSILGMYIQRLLGLLHYDGIKTQTFQTITVTVEKVDKRLSSKIQKAIQDLPIVCGEVLVEEHTESFFSYTNSLPIDLYRFDVLVLQCQAKELVCYHMKSNTQTSPNLVTISEKRVDHFFYSLGEVGEKSMDTLLLEQCKKWLEKSRISSAFLVGEEFEGGWMKQSLRYLCNRTRVFQGRNLYCKGACYRSYFHTRPEEGIQRIYLSQNKTRYNFGLYTIEQEHPVYHNLLSAGGNWYDTKGEWDFYPYDTDQLELIIKSFDQQDVRTVLIPLGNLPNRPEKTLRLRLSIYFEDRDTVLAKVRDCGFGEYYPATNVVWEHEIKL